MSVILPPERKGFLMQPIPLIQVSGTHYEAGRQIGATCRHALAAGLARSRVGLPTGLSWEEMRMAAAPYLAATRRSLPWVVEELAGAAEGSGLDLLDLTVMATEEIWCHPPGSERCSDFAAGPPATADGGVWLAHNNDLGSSTAEHLAGVEWHVEGQPPLFTLGVGGIFISVGYNAAGLSLTGNELSPNDDRIGVPRLLVVRDILSRRSAIEAVAAACNPDRASSYNNLIAHTDGTIVNVEGSGSDYALLPAEEGWTVHTNHYVHPAMRRYEADPGAIGGSKARYQRAWALMKDRESPVTPAMLRAFLADREGAPDCLCKAAGDGGVQTVFWCVIGLHQGEIRFGRDPQEPGEQRFQFR